jgi:hypothetical protein
MATRTWLALSGDWYNSGLWNTVGATNSYPLPGDTVVIASGTVDLLGNEEASIGLVDGLQISLGSTQAANPATIIATEATFGHSTTVTSSGSGAFATLTAIGPTGDSGSIIASAAGGTFTIQATGFDGIEPADFVLLHGGSISVSGGDNLVLVGLITTEGGVTVAPGSTLTNDGTDELFAGTTVVQSGATLNGSGTFDVNADATLTFSCPVPVTETVTFGAAGRLDLGDVAAFAGLITNFVSGDQIDLLNTMATSASYNTATGLLTVMNGGTLVADIKLQGPATGPLQTESDGAGGTTIIYTGSPSRTSLEITTADQAMNSDLVRETMTTETGVPITGTGIKIGIMSDSFNATINGVLDPADAAAMKGYLPENSSGGSAVTILQDSSISGVENEGLAMAELIHQVAPGAQIFFYTAEGGQNSFAAGVNALVSAGVNIIVDDWSFSSEPFYQIAGPVDTAISNAVAQGVSYFSAAGNYGNAYFESTWQPVTTQLVLKNAQPAQTVSAQHFDNGTTLQTISIPSNLATSIDLQWNVAWPNAGASVPDELGMALYTMSGTLVATSHQVSGPPGYGLIPEIDLSVPVSTSNTQYQLAIYQIGPTPVTQFKYILFGSPGSVAEAAAQTNGYSATTLAQDPGGTIDDPAAGQGSGSVHGHQLVPGVNTVGAVYWANTPAYHVPSDWTEEFSSSGPGELLFNQNGTPLTQPLSDGKVDFVAPDGIQTSVPGFQTFSGTSAAAPDAAAVAALMLQADPSLPPAQVASMLAQSAANMGLSAADQGAGLVQALGAVQLALNAAAPLTVSIQNDYLAVTRTALPLDQATTIADAINGGTQTETQYINSLLSQVADTTIPVVAVEASMYGAVGSSTVITNLVTNFLPGQIAYANQAGLDPQVFACLETALVFAFANEAGATTFADNYGPSNAAMPATTAGDAAFAAAATNAIFGSAQTANTANALLGYVNFLEGFFTANGVVGVQNPTADQIVIAARAGAWGEGVAIALENNLGALPGQVTNFLEDAARGTATYSASLSGQPTAAPFQGATATAVAATASLVQVTGVAAPLDHIVM